MKTKLTLLIFALFCTLGAWAGTGTITVKGSSDTSFSANGTFSLCKTTWATMWQSNTTPCLTITSTNHSRYMDGTLLAYADYAMFLPLGYRITGYTISFKSNAAGNSKITGYGEKKASKGSVTSTGTTDEKTLTVSGISTQSVEFKVETNVANVTLFTVNYETADDVMPFVQGGYYRLKEYSGWVTNYYLYAYRSDSNTDRLKKGSADANRVLTHSNYIWKASSVSGSQVQFQNELYGYYMAKLPTNAGQVAASITSNIDDAETFNVINRSAWGAGYISLLAQSPITTAMTVNQGDDISYPFHFLDGCSSGDSLMNGLNYEHQGDVLSVTRVKKVTFSSAVAVNGGSDVSTIYVATDGSESITLPTNYKYTIGGVEMNGVQAATAIAAAGTSDITVTVSSPILVNDQKYRIQQAWSSTRYYLYANTSDASNGNRLWKSSASLTTLLTNANYIWQAKSSSTNWKLYNPAANSGAGRYIAKATSTSVDGTGVNALNASSADDAETFTLVSAESCGYPPSDYSSKCYVALKSNNQKDTYLNSYSTTTNYVGWHNAVHAGYYFSFIPVKTITFSSAIAVNGGDAVSTIYVATDGSDSFTLPDTYLYSFDNGENYVYAIEAASTIASAGTSDMTVTVQDNTTVDVDYHIYYGGSEVASQENVTIYKGDPIVPSSLARDFCTYQYYTTSDMNVELETITAETEEIYVKATWAGPFNLSTNYNSATWYYWKLTDKYVYYDTSTVPYPIIADKTDTNIQYSPYALWAFMGNPYNGIVVLNKAAGSTKCLTSYHGEPQMDSYFDADAKWTITKQSDTKFSLKVGNKCLNNLSGGGKINYWTNSAAPTNSGSALTIEAVTWKELTVADVSLFALNHPTGIYFGLVDDTEVNATINQVKNFAGDFTESMYNTTMSGLNSLINLPEDGFYLIKHVGSNYYLGTNGSIPVLQSSIATSNVAKLEKGSGNSYHISVQGKYIKNNGHGGFVTIEDSPSSAISGKMVGGNVELWSGDSYCVYASKNDYNGQPFGWNSSGTATQWTIEDAAGTELSISLNTVGSKSYATFSAPFPVTIGDEAKAYTVELDDVNDRAVYKEIISKQIPAGAGILLISETAATSVTATISGTDFEELEDNDLVGYYIAPSFSYPDETTNWNLVLGNSASTGIGFYKMNGAASPNKAYLPYPHEKSSLVKGLILVPDDEEETSIHSIDKGQLTFNNAAIYNLSGQRLSKIQKGFNIVNGKKVLK